ncbi:MAG: M23 family metallopeptidase [Actinomycetes bacterium]
MNVRRVALLATVLMMVPINSAHAAPIYVFPVADCTVNYAHAHHDYAATDILAKKGCKFVAPINGVVDEVNRTDLWSGKTNLGIDRGGLYVSIIGEDGVRYYGSHLRTIPASIQPGVTVLAGRLLGTIGTTGSARGTASHLHFGISWPTPADTWWVRRGEVLPWKYLDAWKKGKDLSPVKEVNARKLKVGEIPPVPK